MSMLAAWSESCSISSKIRASQINGRAYCIVMHANDPRKHGENDEWMHLLNAWREAPIYSAQSAPPSLDGSDPRSATITCE